MSTTTTRKADLRFGRILLIYALKRKPLGWIDLTRVLPLAGDPTSEAAYRRLQIGLQQLNRHGLIDVDGRHGKARYRRTVNGRALAERLIRDRRVSFTR